MTQTTVTLTGGKKVNLHWDMDRKSHDKAREALKAIQEEHDMNQRQAVEWALTSHYDAPPKEALQVLSARWDESQAGTVRKALREYEVQE